MCDLLASHMAWCSLQTLSYGKLHVGDLDLAVGPSRTSALLRYVPMNNLGSLVKYTCLVLTGS